MKKSEYTLKDLSKEYDISIKDLRAYVNQGELNAVNIGRSYRIKPRYLKRFLKSDALKNRNKKDHTMPYRNYTCGNYDRCLERAAMANENFGCEGCDSFFQAERRQLHPFELAGIMSLWESVFGKEICIT